MKADLHKERSVTRTEAKEVARHHAMMFAEWSLLEEGHDIDHMMNEFYLRILQTPSLVEPPYKRKPLSPCRPPSSGIGCGSSAVRRRKQPMQYTRTNFVSTVLLLLFFSVLVSL